MVFLIPLCIFLATVLIGFALYWWLETRSESLTQRLQEEVGKESDTRAEGWLDTAWNRFGALQGRFSVKPSQENELLERLSGKELTGARHLLHQAGYRGTGAYHMYLVVRSALPAALVVLVILYAKGIGLTNQSTFLLVLVCGIVGFLLPDFVLRRKIRKRQEEITDALPDGLDLLVVCVEAGLGLNAAFIKITEEFKISSPALSEEFDIVNREMVAGKPRQEALRALTERTGVEDIKSLVAMLIQTEKLGTSLAQSLRVHSDSLRMRRRQKAEEAAAKTTIKLVFPLVFLMFPALFIVILGPGVLQIINVLFPIAK
ncbi:type II secretion system F family protein [Candidatus Deferrimicrobium sp.]|uniref:type II secretion system F family protein n=1 Tax=Candidatus Deferrimicrobium sp. TaxID=3060586 RepID=UPI002ED25049